MGAKTVLVNGCRNGRVAIIKVEKKIRVANLRVTKLLQPIYFSGYLSDLHNFLYFIQMFRFPQFLSDFFKSNDKHVKFIWFTDFILDFL